MPLRIILEYRKGILFVRLKGKLNKDTANKLLRKINLIKENCFYNIVINMKELKQIDLKGINILFYIYEIVKDNDGTLLFCAVDQNNLKETLKKRKILKYIKTITTELDAYKIIKI